MKLMKMRMISILMAVMLIFCLFTGCAAEPKETTPSEPVVTEPAVVLSDLETLYNQGMEVLAQMGDIP